MKSFTYLILAFAILQVSFSQELEFIPEEEVLLGGWTTVDLAAFQNDADGQAALAFGVQFVSSQGEIAGVLPNNSAWNISQLNSVKEQVVAGTNYEFNAKISNADGDSFDAIFIVFSQPFTNTLEVLSVEYIYDEQHEGEVAAGGPEWDVSYEDQELSIFEINNGIAEEFLPGGYVEVSANEAATDPSIQAAQNLGLQAAIAQGLKDGSLPAGNWVLLSTDEVWQQIVAGTNWKFGVTVDNGAGGYANLEYVVFEGLDGTNEVISTAVISTFNVNSGEAELGEIGVEL